MKDVVKLAVKVAVYVAMGSMANDFAQKHVGKPLQKFMDSLAEKKGA